MVCSGRQSAIRSVTVSALVVGDFNGDGHLDLALAEPSDEPEIPMVFSCSSGMATVRSRRRPATRRAPLPMTSWPETSITTDAPTWRSTRPGSQVTAWRSGPWRTGRRPDGARERDPVGRSVVGPMAVGDFNGDGKLDLTYSPARSSILGHGDGTFGPPGSCRTARYRPWWRGISTATASSTWPSPMHYGNLDVSILLGNGDGTFQPRQDTRWRAASGQEYP